MNLLCFTCSTINPIEMFSRKPENYVALSPIGNNLEADLPTLKKYLVGLKKQKIDFTLSIIIGNTDPYYIYTLIGKTCSFYSKKQFFNKFGARWTTYKSNFEKWLKTRLKIDNLKIVSWYEFEKSKGNLFEKMFNKYLKIIDKYFSQDKFAWERNKMKQNFGFGKYFDSLPMPTDKILNQWVKRKFTEYMVQGLWLYENFPNAILLQNEKPTMLRYEMYQPLIREIYNSELKNSFIFGIDNAGYV